MKNALKHRMQNVNVLVIVDAEGRVMYYEDYNDTIISKSIDSIVGRSLLELYPYFEEQEPTVFKAMKARRAILNEYQLLTIDGRVKKALNSAFPLISNGKVIGGLVVSIELDDKIEDRRKKKNLLSRYSFDDIITEDEAFNQALSRLKKIAGNDSSILITGETGTGKELIAHAVHDASRRREKPLFIQNCASIPATLMESILFGTVKGSFTGAMDKEGIFEAADGGTIFLDEINSMPLELQGKILRAIENKTINRVGENQPRDIDVRVIAAANESLEDKVRAGQFREDLYYRLNTIEFRIPPLRERKGDILVLAEYYLEYYNAVMDKQVTGFDQEVKDIFAANRWRGNVRELKNVVEYIVNVKDSGIAAACDLPEYMNRQEERKEGTGRDAEALSDPISRVTGDTLPEKLAEIEKSLIEEAFRSCRYNVSRTAQKLGIPKQTLYYKLKKYEI